MTPSSVTQVVIWLLALVPGIVYRAARMRSAGANSRDLDATHRILGAFVASVVFAACYALLFGDAILELLTTPIAETDLATLGGTAIVCCVVAPMLVAVAVNVAANVAAKENWQDLRGWKSSDKRIRTTTANVAAWLYVNALGRFIRVTPWDLRVPHLGDTWVRIRKRDGVFLMGYLSAEAGFVATYPDRPSLFLSPQASVDSDGTFIKVAPDGRGL
ncbi:DUF6338 family protein [Demequina sp. NBRC 110057]|uniref:DUF6338 family protein n=1 Tax=Demequina sp. NBRC 110057 TaxID=1570346 RepID=UPI0021014E41|nr:DUF6338 family protein [Demequina sp. NBRC 110057]